MISGKRGLTLLLAGCLCLAGGCRSAPPESGEPLSDFVQEQREKWYEGEDYAFTWYLNQDNWNYSKDWAGYPILKEITQITGANPTIQLPAGNAADAFHLMLSSGTLPDMVTLSVNDANIERLIQQGRVYSLDELSEAYTAGFIGEIPARLREFTKSEEDGLLYGLPSFFIQDWRYEQKTNVGAWSYNVRSDFYTELGSPDITTKEGFLQALRDFKVRYPVIDGKESIPLSMGENAWSIEIMEASFGIKSIYVQDGRGYIRYRHPRYRELISFLNQLYRERLLDNDLYLKKLSQLEEDWSMRTFMVPLHFFGFEGIREELEKQGTRFMPVEPLRLDDNLEMPSQDRQGWTLTMITKDAKEPDKLIRFMRYMFLPDGNLLANYGHEDEHYALNGDQLTVLASETGVSRHNNLEMFAEQTGIWTYRFFQYDWYKAKPSMRVSVVDKYAADMTVYIYKMRPLPTSDTGAILTRIDDLVNREMPRIVMASDGRQAMALFDAMLEQMEDMGLDRLEEYYTDRYHKNLLKFK